MKNKYKRLLCIITTIVSLTSCLNSNQTNNKENTTAIKNENNVRIVSDTTKQLEVKTYLNNEKLKGWGYDIYLKGSLYIHQPHIPAINGEKGFETEEEAKLLGDFISNKIMNNIIPPSVTIKELDSLKVNK